MNREPALKALTDEACMHFGRLGQAPPILPRPLADYVPCRVLIETYKNDNGRAKGHMHLIRSDGGQGYHHEWHT